MIIEIMSVITIVALVWAALLGLQLLQTNIPDTETELSAVLSGVPRQRWHFVALEYYLGILNRTYAVFVTDRMLCGAKVRGLLAAPVNPNQRWRDPYFYPRPKLVASYTGVDLESSSFKTLNSSNFQVSKDQVDRVEFDDSPKWGMGTVPYSGRIFLHMRGGGKRELILLGNQHGSQIAERLRFAGFGRAAA